MSKQNSDTALDFQVLPFAKCDCEKANLILKSFFDVQINAGVNVRDNIYQAPVLCL